MRVWKFRTRVLCFISLPWHVSYFFWAVGSLSVTEGAPSAILKWRFTVQTGQRLDLILVSSISLNRSQTKFEDFINFPGVKKILKSLKLFSYEASKI